MLTRTDDGMVPLMSGLPYWGRSLWASSLPCPALLHLLILPHPELLGKKSIGIKLSRVDAFGRNTKHIKVFVFLLFDLHTSYLIRVSRQPLGSTHRQREC
jgi:hypothetical protein